MNFFNEKNIAKVSFACAAILISILTLSSGLLFIANKIDELEKDLIQFEQNFIVEQKKQVKVDVSALQAQIDSRRSSIHHKLEQHLINKVEEARATALNIYKTMQDSMPKKEIAKVIKEAIRPVRIGEQQGYCFILTLDGTAALYPANKALEGTNFITNGVDGCPDITANIISLARNSGKGFLRYSWTKPEDETGTLYPKISYVSFFEPLGWVIGTGEYIDNLESQAKKTLIDELQGSLGRDVTDYFFIYDLHNPDGGNDFATMLINNNRPDLVGKKLTDNIVDAKGKEFRKEFLKGIRADGEAYVVYWYKKTDGSGVGRKLSYFKLYPKWNWVVAQGIYLDRIDTIISTKKEELSTKVKHDIVILILIFLVAVTIALFVAYFLSRELQKIFDRYRRTQEKHLKKLEALNSRLKKQSQTDALTKISNRGFFNKQLAREAALSKRYKTPLSLILFDIDHFKRVNDTFGHLAGDKILQELANLISDNIRQTDVFARWGGEEFAILAPGINLEQTHRFAEKLRTIVAKHTFTVAGNITCSFGGSSYTPQEKSEDLLQRTDEALYHAKNGGRNMCVIN